MGGDLNVKILSKASHKIRTPAFGILDTMYGHGHDPKLQGFDQQGNDVNRQDGLLLAPRRLGSWCVHLASVFLADCIDSFGCVICFLCICG
jgi:hypothetical protein